MIEPNTTSAVNGGQSKLEYGGNATGLDRRNIRAFFAILSEQMQYGNYAQVPANNAYGAYPAGPSSRQGLAGLGGGLPGMSAMGGCVNSSYPFASVAGMAGVQGLVVGVADRPLTPAAARIASFIRDLDVSGVIGNGSSGAVSGEKSVGEVATSALETESDTLRFVELPKDKDELGEEIGNRVAALDKQGYDKVNFSVDHPKYGRVGVSIGIEGNKVNLAISTQDADLRAALESASGSLSKTLADKGMTLASFDVSDTPISQNGTFMAPQSYPTQMAYVNASQVAMYAALLDEANEEPALGLVSDIA